MSTNQTELVETTTEADKPRTVARTATKRASVIPQDLRDIVAKADESDEAVQKVLKRASLVKSDDPLKRDKMAEITREFASLTFDTKGMNGAIKEMVDFTAEARKLSNAHTRYRTRIISAWLRIFPDGYVGLKSDIARALYLTDKPSKGHLMSVKRDMDALSLTLAAAEGHKADSSAPTLSIEAARTLATNASPQAIKDMADNLRKGKPPVKPGKADKSDETVVPVKPDVWLGRLERVVDDLRRVPDISVEQRNRAEQVVADMLRILRGLRTTSETPKPGEAPEK